MSSNALARLGEEEGKCWAFGESCRVVPAEVAREVVVALQAERDTLAAKLKDAEHDRDEFRRVMNGFAEKMAELEGQEPVAWIYDWQAPEGLIKGWVETNRDEIPEYANNIRPIYASPVPAEMSPDFTDTARAALLWVLWHHQGGSSPVGQPIRYALGMDAHEHLSKHQVQEAKRWAALTKSESNDFRQARTAPPEPVNARLLTAARAAVAFIEGKPDAVEPFGLLREAIAAAESAPKAVRLTEAERLDLVSGWVKSPQRILEELAAQVETAVLRKNGIEVSE